MIAEFLIRGLLQVIDSAFDRFRALEYIVDSKVGRGVCVLGEYEPNQIPINQAV
jgi:hypothetical protein